MSAIVGRAECARCRRPLRLCLCGAIPQLEPRTGLTVLQHPRERRHPVGTARFVELGLGARVLSPVHHDRSLVCSETLPEGTAVLFPGPEARDVETLDEGDRPRHLLVLDGTWNHVRGLYRANPWIAELPHVRLTPTAPSRYRIRREPHRHFLSTIEAVVAALRALEPGLEGLDALLDAFDRMVDAQLTWADGLERSPRTRAKERRSARCLPRALHEQFEELVVVYAEWSEPPAARQSGGRTPIQWSAVRPSTGESFERCVRPTDAHAEARFIELGLERSDASSESAAVEALVEFIGPGGVVASWDRAPLLHLEGALGDQQMLSLRDAYRALRGRTRGALETVLAREGATAAPLALGGRASERLGNAVALVSLLRALAAR